MPKPATTAKLVLSCVLFLAVAACSSAAQTAQADLSSIVKAKLGSHYTSHNNQSNSYALYQQSPNGDHMNRAFKFIVVNISEKKVVREGSFKNGYVKWVDDKSIEVASAGADEKLDKQVILVEDQKS
jgi:hypothetical protein